MSGIHNGSFYGTVAAKGICTHLTQAQTDLIPGVYPGCRMMKPCFTAERVPLSATGCQSVCW